MGPGLRKGEMAQKIKYIVFLSSMISLLVAALPLPCEASFLGTKTNVLQGDSIQPFTTQDLNGNDVNLADYIGRKVILLDFWSIYCAPCVEEMPGLIELYNKYNQKGLIVFGISLDSQFNATRLTKFVKGFEQTIPYPIIHDARSEIRQLYGVSTLPTTIIIDARGKVRLVHIGFTEEDKKLINDYILDLILDGNGESTSSVAE
jgi:peroxiredoxin